MKKKKKKNEREREDRDYTQTFLELHVSKMMSETSLGNCRSAHARETKEPVKCGQKACISLF